MMFAGVQALVLALATALPSPTPSPSPSPTPAPRPLFVAPKRWVPVSIGKADKQQGFLAHYFSTGSQLGDFNVVEGRNVGLPIEQFAKVNVASVAHDLHATVLESAPVMLCDGQSGWQVRYHKPEGQHQLTFTQVFGVTETHAYIATYARPMTAKDDPTAIAAVHSLCPPREQGLGADMSAVPIQPPQGWQRLNPSALSASPDFIAFWIGDTVAGFPESLNVIRTPTTGAMPMADEAPLVIDGLKRKYPGLTLRESHAERLCGKLDGWYFEYGAHVRNHDVIVEQATVLDGNMMYVASYGRANGTPENAAARASLDTLCPENGSFAS